MSFAFNTEKPATKTTTSSAESTDGDTSNSGSAAFILSPFVFSMVKKAAVEQSTTFISGIFSQPGALASSSAASKPDEEEGSPSISALIAAVAVTGIAVALGFDFVVRQIDRRNEARLAAQSVAASKENLNVAHTLVNMLEHPHPDVRKKAAEALGDVFPKLNPGQRRVLAFKVTDLLNHRHVDYTTLEALGRIVPALKDPKDRKLCAEAVSEILSAATPRTIEKVARALEKIINSLDPADRTRFDKYLIDNNPPTFGSAIHEGAEKLDAEHTKAGAEAIPSAEDVEGDKEKIEEMIEKDRETPKP